MYEFYKSLRLDSGGGGTNETVLIAADNILEYPAS